jgi:hypothetical protein
MTDEDLAVPEGTLVVLFETPDLDQCSERRQTQRGEAKRAVTGTAL